ncbi:MAG: hypothetical protein R3244_07160 [Thermoanaerobaculia bacterium]|nr:hypothetical protein [Thermoanaerobaculia bacterium]
MSTERERPGPPPRRRPLRSVVWAAIGCTLLTVLGLAGLTAAGYFVTRLLD